MPLEERLQRHTYGPPDEASDSPAHDKDDESKKEGVVVVHIFSFLKAAGGRHADEPPDGPEHDHDDELSKEGVVVHIFSKRDIEPDYSGYVDEYRFIPLTPSLEETLGEMVSDGTFSRRDEALELEELGYIRDLVFHLSSLVSFEVTARGRRYADEAAAYRDRRDRWAASRAEEERRRGRSVFMREAAIALLSAAAGSAAMLLATG